jgi:serine/threonine protein kinase
MSGGSLKNLIVKFRLVDESTMRKYAAQILAGLKELHLRDVPHRSLNLNNIMIDNNGYLKLTDFGIYAKIRGLNLPSLILTSLSLELVEKPVSFLSKSALWNTKMNHNEIERAK